MKIKIKKPKFIQQDTNRKKSLKLKWRKPRGMHSKLRLNKAGHRKKPSQGFRSPRKERFLVSGLKINLVKNLNDLTNITEGAVLLSSKIGNKKKLDILNKAKDMKLQLLNIKNIDEFIRKTTEAFEKKKQEKKKKQTEKSKEKERAVKEAEKKKLEEKKEERKETKPKPEAIPQPQLKPSDTSQKQSQQIVRPTAPKQK